MEDFKRSVKDIFLAKQKRRKYLAERPVEEKIKILVELQRIASPILRARGIRKEPWKI